MDESISRFARFHPAKEGLVHTLIKRLARNVRNLNILGFHPRDKAAMLGDNIYFFRRTCLKIKFSSQWTIVLTSQHGRHDVTCKPAMARFQGQN